MRRAGFALTLFSMFAIAPAAVAETLVVAAAPGRYQPGAATSWAVTDGAVVFSLMPSVDPATVVRVLSERLFNAQITVDGQAIRVEGIPPERLLEQVSAIPISGDTDDLDALAALGGTQLAMAVPEGGGSIRAARPEVALLGADRIEEPAVDLRWVGQVVEVTRRNFPSVVLKIRVLRPPPKASERTRWRRGRVVEAPVVLATNERGIDFSLPINQRNLGAFYLSPGDRVTVHVRGPDQPQIDFIERRSNR